MMSTPLDMQKLMLPISREQPCGISLDGSPLLASIEAWRLFGRASPFDERPGTHERSGAPDWALCRAKALDGLGSSKEIAPA